ncbi:exopolysaccharide biosynthesis polyprenyl glycosylphosphotransferase [bacterium]|nr:exopolysaccharide biosynthesis polyprenyl glycosylphosphotransferase [bacterium]
MKVLSRSIYLLGIIDALIIAFVTFFSFAFIAKTYSNLFVIVGLFLISILLMLGMKGFYKLRQYGWKDIYLLFEGIFIGAFIATALSIPLLGGFAFYLVLIDILLFFVGILFVRICYLVYKKIFKPVKNILIVGAGQDGKLIAEEIQSRPELGMKVIGFLDDNMNSIEEEDSTIPILGLTYDSEAVIKDNNVDMVIIAVKSRMDSNILTDLAKGIPLGVKVWRMPTFYSYITQKLFTNKMAVNWLFYDYVRPKHILYSRLKKVIDIICALVILILTLPITLLAMIRIKLTDFGPIFFTQTRIGKFGKPFRMIKFRTMYQDKVDEDFDDEAEEIYSNDSRIMSSCKLIRKYHIDDIPQMFNILKGEMSLVGPRPVREEVHYRNQENIPFWECRNWVRPGLTGWQQINAEDCIPEERLGYDLYYVKHRTLLWEFSIFLRYVAKLITGRLK